MVTIETINPNNYAKAVRRVVVALQNAETPLSFAEVAEQTGMPEHIAAYWLGCLSLSLQIEFGEVTRFSWPWNEESDDEGEDET